MGSMPWKVSEVVEQRWKSLREYETGEWTMTELCRAYEISRPTGYALCIGMERRRGLSIQHNWAVRGSQTKGCPYQTICV